MSDGLPSGLSPQFWRSFQPKSRMSESLEVGEEWIGSWDAIGLYEGNNKVPNYQSLLIHITTHRLILLPNPDPSAPSGSRPPIGLETHLSYVRQTEFYTGFMRSSPKITIFLGKATNSLSDSPDTSPTEQQQQTQRGETQWTCGVCGMINTLPGHQLSPSASNKCSLCGVSYSASRTSAIPPTRGGTPAPESPKDNQPTKQATEPPSTTPGSTKEGIACPACTFLNHRSMNSCEICGTSLPRKSGTISRVEPAVNGGDQNQRLEVIRLSFRKGGSSEAYKKLKSALSSKTWEREITTTRPRNSTQSDPTSPGAGRSAAGIDGILQTISLDAKAKDESMQSAFEDLEILMIRAGEMVRLAQNLNARLTAAQESSGGSKPSEEEATLIRSSLVQLGLPAPALTSDMVKSDREYHEGLARELGILLTGGVSGSSRNGEQVQGLMIGKDGRGVLGLDEVWGMWMRARGVALLSPSTLVAIIPFLAAHTSPPIRSMSLPSGLMVLYSPTYSPITILSRLLSLLQPTTETETSLNIIEISAHEGLPIGLAKEIMEEVEKLRVMPNRSVGGSDGLVRDDQAGQGSGTRWYRDIISTWPIEAI